MAKLARKSGNDADIEIFKTTLTFPALLSDIVTKLVN
jgi:hypothetical protein